MKLKIPPKLFACGKKIDFSVGRVSPPPQFTSDKGVPNLNIEEEYENLLTRQLEDLE